MYKNIVSRPLKGSLLFKVKQIFLDMKTPSVTHQFTIGADYTVAGDNNGNRIAIIGHTHCPAGLEITCSYGYILIGTCFTVGNILKGIPHPQLKGSTFWRKGKIKCFSFPFKVFL